MIDPEQVFTVNLHKAMLYFEGMIELGFSIEEARTELDKIIEKDNLTIIETGGKFQCKKFATFSADRHTPRI